MLVGRDAERARLQTVLSDARDGRSSVLVVSGEAGVGKTALLEDAVAAAEEMRVVRVRGVESEAAMPFGALFDVCRPFLGSVPELPERQRRALEGALALGPATEGDRFAIGAATLGLLAADVREDPLLLVVDDAQWVDTASAESLAFALRRLDTDGVGVLIAARSGARGVLVEAGFEMLEVERLGETEAASLALSRRPVSTDEAARIARVSEGNPLAVLELVASDMGVPGGLVPIPEHLERTFAARVEDLPDATRTALLVAAADDLGRLDVLARCAPLDALGPAEDAGLVQIAEGRLEFRHPLVRSAVYQRASTTERRAAHAVLASAMPADQSGRAAWHRAASVVEPDEAVASSLEDVALAADARNGPAFAAATWGRAAELTPDPHRRARRLLGAASSAWDAGMGEIARHAAEGALELAVDPLLRADIVRARGRIASLSGGLAREVAGTLRAEAVAVAPLDPVRAAYLLADAVAAFWPAWDTEPNVEIARAARGAGPPGDPLFDFTLGFELARRGDLGEASELLAAAERAIVGDPLRRDNPLELIRAGVCAWWRNDPRSGCAFDKQAVQRARELGMAGVVANALAELADAQIVVGDWDEADASLIEATRLSEDTGQATSLGIALSRRAEIAARRGEVDRFEELTAAASGYVGTAAPVRAYERNSRCLLGLGLGQPELAIAAREATERYGIEQLSAPALDLIEAYIRAERVADAADRLKQVTPHVHLDEPRAAYLRCQAMLAGQDAADRLFRESIELFASTGDVFEEARSQLGYGERLRRAGRRRDARVQLIASLDVFERLRAPPWAERARRELQASGARRIDRTPEARDQLTPQERQIATLAADGRTNREIGALLFLSPRTIETHLGRVFRKVGVRHRRELATRMRSAD